MWALIGAAVGRIVGDPRVGDDCGGGGGEDRGGSAWAMIAAAVGSAGVQPRQAESCTPATAWTPTLET